VPSPPVVKLPLPPRTFVVGRVTPGESAASSVKLRWGIGQVCHLAASDQIAANACLALSKRRRLCRHVTVPAPPANRELYVERKRAFVSTITASKDHGF